MLFTNIINLFMMIDAATDESQRANRKDKSVLTEKVYVCSCA